MAYTYAAFEAEANDTARLTMLRLHIAEVEALVTADYSSDGKSKNAGSLNQKLDRLYRRLEQLEQSPSTRRNGGLSHARLRRAE